MSTVLILGGGCREHTLAWKISQSSLVKKVFVAPGNGLTQTEKNVSNLDLNIKNVTQVLDWCITNKPSVVVVGPEDPLNMGITDALDKMGIKCFGPSKAAAQIECDKDFAKRFMDRHRIPTARFKTFTKSEDAINFVKTNPFGVGVGFVVKATGLAGGKGVLVPETNDEGIKYIKDVLDDKIFGDAGNAVVIEEKLEGFEVSVMTFSDGSYYSVMPPAQDHKRAYDNDQGLNTGGMGAVCPVVLDKDLFREIEKTIVKPAIRGMKAEGIPFVGTLYPGLMVTKFGPKVIEFNCRFGDPETQVILPLLETDLYEVIMACVNGKLDTMSLKWSDKSACSVVLASEGYPGPPSLGRGVTGIPDAKKKGLSVFGGGVKGNENKLVSSGGRILTVVSVAKTLEEAIDKGREGAGLINCTGSFYRKDIGSKEVKRKSQGLTYKAAGVDIIAGEELVDDIKKFARMTNRSGVMDNLGGFGALFDAKAAGYTDPILVSGTDGVGTKLRVALECKMFETVGIDLVAMCVNDILVQGAEPLFFLDYFACASLDVQLASRVVRNIALGCRESGCALIGGETAEMPGMYHGGDFDLAGFAVGAVDRSCLLPRMQDMIPGDVVIGIPSSGAHSNGFSLIRKLVAKLGLSYNDPSPFLPNQTLGESLLTATRLYVTPLLPIVKQGLFKGLAHITGGGILQNIPRVTPNHIGIELDGKSWKLPPVFQWIQREGNMSDEDMMLTFNCGIGMACIVAKEDVESVMKRLKVNGIHDATVIGKLTERKADDVPIKVDHFGHGGTIVFEQKKKRVAVLISGSGTNLQSLIDYTQENGDSSCQIVCVVSNVPNVQGLVRAEKARIPAHVVPSKGKTREVFETELIEVLKKERVEVVVLAGFMRVLTSKFVTSFTCINMHPALLPSFAGSYGIQTHELALAAGVRIHGATVHFVDEGVDTGAIILQKAVDVLPGDTPSELQERVKTEAEHKIYPRALELVCSGEVYLDPTDKKVKWKGHN